MKRFPRIFSIIGLLLLSLICLAACGETKGDDNKNNNSQPDGPIDEVDYVSQLKLNMDSNTKKTVATVKNYVDGDTTHFNVNDPAVENGVIKARYLAINTPESTIQIEPWGKKASNFTKGKLKAAQSIIIESDNSTWNLDSTGGRTLCWVWYRTSETEDYRNLNLEILQNGLAIASNTAANRYGDICVKALNQAKALKINCFSPDKDPDFYYGEAQVVSLKELRNNLKKYEGTTVAFEANVCKNYNNALYVEDYDNESGLYFGMYIYLGYGLSGAGLEICEISNRVMFVGSLQYYETGGTYQIADLKYQAMRPDDPTNIKLVEKGGHGPNFTEIRADDFVDGTVTLEFTDPETEKITSKECKIAEMILDTSVSMNSLVVKSVYTTTNEDSSSKGAMTLTCEVDGKTIKVRTVVLKDASGATVTEDAFKDKTIDVKGYVDYFDGDYQIKVFSMNDVTFID